MKLWEAIQLAGKNAVQAVGVFADTWTTPGIVRVCAQGAALLAVRRLRLDGDNHIIMAERWPELTTRRAICPVAGCGHSDLLIGAPGRLISHINNDHLWTFQQIADWLRSIEEAGDI